jgi:hypothetical protein
LGVYFTNSNSGASVFASSQPSRWKRAGYRGDAVILLMVPAVGSVYAVLSWPVNIFPYIFLGYLAIGLAWFLVLRRRPEFATIISDRIHTEHRSIEAAATDALAGDVNRRLETVVA